jgi:endonuclease YncB( thermonuclease family)
LAAPVGAANAAPPSVRPVQPDVFAYPVTPQAGALERVEARPFQMAKDPAVTLLKTQAIARPMTIEAGLIAVGKATLQLEGLKPTARTRQCESSTGVPWPCGMVARTQQRLFFRNRTLDCALDSLSWQGVRVADCALSGKSVGEWLVENGWAEAAAGSPLVEKGRQAVAARLGLFGDDPR